jgi:hypothetical protein
MAADWAAIRVEYVSGAETFGKIAKRHGVKEATVRQRANREGWQDQRAAASRAVTQKAEAILGDARVDEMTKFNEDDLRMARALRAKAAGMLAKGALSPADLRSLASTVETAQKVGRLALGAITDNVVVGNRELPASVHEFV